MTAIDSNISRGGGLPSHYSFIVRMLAEAKGWLNGATRSRGASNVSSEYLLHQCVKVVSRRELRCLERVIAGPPVRMHLARWLGLFIMFTLAGCMVDTRFEKKPEGDEGATARSALQGSGCWHEDTNDSQKTCAGGFIYGFACHARQSSPACPIASTESCSSYSAELALDPACALDKRETRQVSVTLEGYYKEIKVCERDIDGDGIVDCDFELKPFLYKTCGEYAQSQVEKLRPEDAALVTFTASQGPIQEYGDVWASCDVTYYNWPFYTKTIYEMCRHPSHPLAPTSECGPELRQSAQGLSLAQVSQEAQSAWEVLGGLGPVPYTAAPLCTSCSGVLPTERLNGMTPGVTAGTAVITDDGASSYSIPLWLPEGRAGLKPELGIHYSSRGGNGPLGIGFALSGLPRITRCPKTVAQDGRARDVLFNALDRFCLEGQRLVLVSGSYGADGAEYRTESDMFARIVSVGTSSAGPDHFLAHLKDGRILTFGGPGKMLAGKRSDVKRTSIGPFDWVTNGWRYAWSIAHVEDRSGNSVNYEYGTAQEEGAELWPTKVEWTGHAGSGLLPQRSVRFFYEERPDVEQGYVSGFKLREPRRLSRLEMWGPSPSQPMLLRSYRFSYANTSITGRSQLTQIQECDGTGACKRPTRFEWTQGGNTFSRQRTHIPVDWLNAQGQSVTMDAVFAGDFGGNGYDSLLRHTSQDKWLLNGASTQIPDSPVRSGRVADVDGDGRMEFFKTGAPPFLTMRRWMRYAGTEQHDNLEWDGDDNGPYAWSGYSQYEPGEMPLYLADINGDGLPEALYLSNNSYKWSFRTNQNGILGSAIELPVHGHRDAQSYVARVDGSGMMALVTREYNANPDGIDTYLHALTVPSYDATSNTLYTTPTTLLSRTSTGEHRRYWFADVNGDGLADAVNIRVVGGEPYLHINTGNGFRGASMSTLAPEFQSGQFTTWYRGDPPGVFVVDLNLDGKQDILLAQKYYGHPNWQERTHWVLWKSTGSGFVAEPLSVPLGDIGPSYTPVHATLLDYNGDGLTDILQSETVPDSGSSSSGRELVVYLRQGAPPDLLSAVVDGADARSEFGYRPLRQDLEYIQHYWDRRDHKLPKLELPQEMVHPGMWVAHELKLDDGKGGFNHYTHTYTDGRRDLLRGFLGFGGHTVKHEQTGATTYTAYDVSKRTVGSHAYPLVGYPLYQRTQVTLASGTIHVSESSSNYSVHQDASGAVYFASPNRITSVNVELPPGQLPPAGASWLPGASAPGVAGAVVTSGIDVLQNYDDDGNLLLQETKWMWGGDYTGEKLQVSTTYTPRDAANWLIGLPESRVTRHATETQLVHVRKEEFEYHPGTGLLKARTVEPDDVALKLRTEYLRNAHGLPYSVTVMDGAGRSRAQTLTYDSLEQARPTTVTNALGHIVSTEYHPGLGVVVARTDPNGVRVGYQHDGFGRLRIIDRPDGADSAVGYGWSHDGLAEVRTQGADGSGSLMRIDKLGRVVEEQVTGFDGQPVVSRRVYDALGRLEAVSAPRSGAELERLTTYTYDKLGRPLFESRPDGTRIEQRYFPGYTETIDARGHVSYVAYDAVGRVVESAEGARGSANLLTRFTYWPFDLLREVQVREANQPRVSTRLTYDLLGRRTLLEEYYGTSETAGYREQTRYEDAFGQRVHNIDAKGQEVTFEYDVLGRLVLKDAPEGDSIYTWDQGAGAGIGRLASFVNYDEGVQVAYSYDALGRPSRSSWSVINQLEPQTEVFDIDRHYDTFGRLESIDYPTVPGQPRFRAVYGYNASGYLNEVTGAGNQLFWRADGFDARGRLTAESFGNGVSSIRVYDPVRHVLRSIQTQSSTGGYLQRLSFDFDANGNLELREDALAQVREEFTYDAQERLRDWMVQAPSGNSHHFFRYDGLGRLTAREVLAGQGSALTLGYDDSGASSPFAPRTSNLDSFSYDANGNQTEGPKRWVDYMSFGLPRRVSTWTSTAYYFYGPGDTRLMKKSSSGALTTYIEDLYERRLTSSSAEHVFFVKAGDRTVAQATRKEVGGVITEDAVRYVHEDHLGSPETLTDETGALLERLRFDPFGVRASVVDPVLPAGAIASGDVRHGFTSHEMEDDLELINMRGRVYDPRSAHFLSRDPVIQSPLNPRAHNRYAYVGYNPLSVIDPTGFIGEQTEIRACLFFCSGPSGGSLITLAPGSGLSSGKNGASSNTGRRANGADDNNTPPPQPVQGSTVATAQNAPGPSASLFKSLFDLGVYFSFERQLYDVKALMVLADVAMGGDGVFKAPDFTGCGYSDTCETQWVPAPKPGFNSEYGLLWVQRLATFAPLIPGGASSGVLLSSARAGSVAAATRVSAASPAAKGPAAKAYSVAFETAIPKVGAGTRAAHFKAANEALSNQMKASPEFSDMIRGMGIDVPMSSTNSALGRSPLNWTWHHVSEQPGVMQLVPTPQHQGSAWQRLLHPNQEGGFKIWGGDY